jgi:hypothetical protein
MSVRLFVEFDGYDGIAVPDGKASEYVANVLRTVTKEFAQEDLYPDEIIDPVKVRVGTSLMIDFFRLAVVSGSLKPEHIKFVFKDHKDSKNLLEVDENGRLSRYPEGFCDHTTEVLAKLVAKHRR